MTIGAYPLKQMGSPQREQQDILINGIAAKKQQYGEQKDVHIEAGAKPINKGWGEDLIINSHGTSDTVDGMDAATLAQTLVNKGYGGGGKIILSACNSSAYAAALSKELKQTHGINVEVIGALAPVLMGPEIVEGYEDKGWTSSSTFGTDRQSLLGTKRPEASKGLCFLTTACVRAMQLPDNCEELETLRRFRDEQLLKAPGGDDVISQYYTTAPLIISGIEEQLERDWIYASLYDNVIVPCVFDIKAKRFQLAFLRYRNAVTALSSRFVPGQISDLSEPGLAGDFQDAVENNSSDLRRLPSPSRREIRRFIR